MAVCNPPHPSPSSLARPRLDLFSHSCPNCTVRVPRPKSLGWDRIAPELRSSMGCSHSNMFVSPQFLRTSQLQNVFGFPQCDVFGDSREFCNSDIVVPRSDSGRRKKQLIKRLCRNGFPHCQASQCSLHNAPILRLLLAVAANGTHQCESMICCGAFSPNLCGRGFDLQENGSGMSSTPAGQFAHSQLPAQGLKPFSFLFGALFASSC